MKNLKSNNSQQNIKKFWKRELVEYNKLFMIKTIKEKNIKKNYVLKNKLN